MVDRTFERLTSGRLVLRRFRSADIEAFVRYRADPAIARFQSWENFTPEDGGAFFDWVSGQHPDTPGEWFQFAIELAGTGAMIGDCAMHSRADSRTEVEIGFTLAPAHHGRGYARKRSGACSTMRSAVWRRSAPPPSRMSATRRRSPCSSGSGSCATRRRAHRSRSRARCATNISTISVEGNS